MDTSEDVHNTLSTSDCRVQYWVLGPTNRPLVALTHAAFLDHLQFVPQVHQLAKHFRVLVWDVPGHGVSQPLSGAFTTSGAAGTLRYIIDELGYTKVVLVGVSMGAAISQQFA